MAENVRAAAVSDSGGANEARKETAGAAAVSHRRKCSSAACHAAAARLSTLMQSNRPCGQQAKSAISMNSCCSRRNARWHDGRLTSWSLVAAVSFSLGSIRAHAIETDADRDYRS